MSDYKNPDEWINQSGDVDKLVDKIAERVERRVFDHGFTGTDAFGKDRNGAPYHLIISALLKTNEDQSNLLEEVKTQNAAILGELSALRAAQS